MPAKIKVLSDRVQILRTEEDLHGVVEIMLTDGSIRIGGDPESAPTLALGADANGKLDVVGDIADIVADALQVGTLTYPAADGTPNQVLTTDGAGNLSLQDAGGGLNEIWVPFDTGNVSATSTEGGLLETGTMTYTDIGSAWPGRAGLFEAGFDDNIGGWHPVPSSFQGATLDVELVHIPDRTTSTGDVVVGFNFDSEVSGVALASPADYTLNPTFSYDGTQIADVPIITNIGQVSVGASDRWFAWEFFRLGSDVGDTWSVDLPMLGLIFSVV